MNHKDFTRPFIVPPGEKISLKKDYDPGFTNDFPSEADADEELQEGIEQLAKYQDILYAQDQYALLVILQAMDAAGKDSVIKHVMTGLNPQGCEVHSFKEPSAEELDHDYLWRASRVLPERGRIGIFNRSYYEEVLVVRVHPQILQSEHLPPDLKDEDVWKHRYREINDFERYLVENGTMVVKLFLNVSKDEQRKRFLKRIEEPEKNWKFSAADVRERAFWKDYMDAYEDMLNHTSTEWASWYVIPADNKWFTHLAVARIIHRALAGLDLAYPQLTAEHEKELEEARKLLESEEA